LNEDLIVSIHPKISHSLIGNKEVLKPIISNKDDERCGGLTKAGTSCKRYPKAGQLRCAYHLNQVNSNDNNEAVVEHKKSEEKKNLCHATTKAGKPCSRTVKDNDTLCYMHKNSFNSVRGFDNSAMQCIALTQKKERCTKTASNGAFCGMHSKMLEKGKEVISYEEIVIESNNPIAEEKVDDHAMKIECIEDIDELVGDSLCEHRFSNNERCAKDVLSKESVDLSKGYFCDHHWNVFYKDVPVSTSVDDSN